VTKKLLLKEVKTRVYFNDAIIISFQIKKKWGKGFWPIPFHCRWRGLQFYDKKDLQVRRD
jgi:hypothetical protein